MIPAYRLLMSYNIQPEKQERYYRYMLAEFVPAMQKVGLHMIFAWQVSFGAYPERQVEFVCQDQDTLRALLKSEQWKVAEARLRSFTTEYRRKVVRFQDRFQM